MRSWLVQHAAIVALTLVVALVAQRTLPDRLGGAAAATGLLTLFVVVTLNQFRPEPVLPLFPSDPLAGRWWYVLGAAVVALG